jgi:hypothetical protein
MENDSCVTDLRIDMDQVVFLTQSSRVEFQPRWIYKSVRGRGMPGLCNDLG